MPNSQTLHHPLSFIIILSINIITRTSSQVGRLLVVPTLLSINSLSKYGCQLRKNTTEQELESLK